MHIDDLIPGYIPGIIFIYCDITLTLINGIKIDASVDWKSVAGDVRF